MTIIAPNTHECDYGGLQLMSSFVHTGRGLKEGYPWLFTPVTLCYKLHQTHYSHKIWPFSNYTSRTRSLLLAFYVYPFVVTTRHDLKINMRLSTSKCQGLDILCGASKPPYTGQLDVPGVYAGKVYFSNLNFLNIMWCRKSHKENCYHFLLSFFRYILQYSKNKCGMWN